MCLAESHTNGIGNVHLVAMLAGGWLIRDGLSWISHSTPRGLSSWACQPCLIHMVPGQGSQRGSGSMCGPLKPTHGADTASPTTFCWSKQVTRSAQIQGAQRLRAREWCHCKHLYKSSFFSSSMLQSRISKLKHLTTVPKEAQLKAPCTCPCGCTRVCGRKRVEILATICEDEAFMNHIALVRVHTFLIFPSNHQNPSTCCAVSFANRCQPFSFLCTSLTCYCYCVQPGKQGSQRQFNRHFLWETVYDVRRDVKPDHEATHRLARAGGTPEGYPRERWVPVEPRGQPFWWELGPQA